MGFEEWLKDVAPGMPENVLDNANKHYEHLLKLVTGRSTIEAASILAKSIRETMVKSPENIACSPGCAVCCSQKFTITLPDAVNLIRGLPEVISKSALVRARTRKKPGLRSVCPLLDNTGNCTIYENRPVLCRRYYSIDAELCKLIPAGGRNVPTTYDYACSYLMAQCKIHPTDWETTIEDVVLGCYKPNGKKKRNINIDNLKI